MHICIYLPILFVISHDLSMISPPGAIPCAACCGLVGAAGQGPQLAVHAKNAVPPGRLPGDAQHLGEECVPGLVNSQFANLNMPI